MVLSKEIAIGILENEKARFLDENVDYGNVANAYDMAIDCLKAKAKSVKIVAVRAELDYDSWHYECPVCNGYVDAHDKYCRHCGVPLEV